MSELAVHWVSVVPDTSKLAPEVKKAFGDVGKSAGVQGRSWGNRFTTAAGRAAKKAAKGGLFAAAAGFTALGVAGVKSAVQIDRARATLTGLYGSASAAEDTLKRLKKVAAGSPIKYGDYLKAGESMAYMGLQGEQAATVLSNVGAAITATGGGGVELDRVNRGLLKIVNNGKVYATDLGMISDAGVPIFSGLAAHFGTNIENVRSMVTEGKVGLEDVLSVMENATGDTFTKQVAAGEKVTQTLAKQWSVATDAIGTSLGVMIEPYLPAISAGIASIGASLQRGITEHGPKIIDSLGSAFSWLSSTGLPVLKDLAAWFGENLGPYIKDAVGFIGDFINSLKGAGDESGFLATALGGLVDAGKSVVEWLTDHRGIVWSAVGAYVAFKVAVAGVSFVKFVVGLGASAKALWVDTAAMLANTKAKLASKAETVALAAMYGKDFVVKVARATAGWVANTASIVANKIAAAAQKAVWTGGWILGQVGMVTRSTAAWAANNAALAIAYTRATVTAAAIKAKTIAIGAWTVVTKVATVATRALWTAVKAHPLAFVVAAIGLLVAGVIWAYKNVGWFRTAVDVAWAGIKKAISLAWNFVIKPVFAALNAYITNVLVPVIRWLWNNVVRPVFSALGRHISTVWNNVIKPAFGFLRKGVSKVGDVFSSVIGAIRSGWGKLKGIVQAPISAAIKIINGFIRAVNKIPGIELPLVLSSAKSAPKGTSTRALMRATGGPILGPGTGTSDSIPLWGSNGEHMWTAAEVKAAGGHGGMYKLRSAVMSGALRLAKGGPVVPGRGNRHTSGYGWATYAGDFPNPIGTPVRAWKDGVIALVRTMAGSYGKHMRMNHTDGTSSLYAHLSSFAKSVGDRVRQGTMIGRVGSTGNSTGPHLHLETMGGHYKGGPGGGGGSVWDTLKGASGKIAGWIKSKLLDKANIGGLFGNVSGLFKTIGNGIKDHVLDKLFSDEAKHKVSAVSPGLALASRLFDSGGVAVGAGFMPKNTIAPERVLSPSSTRALDEGLRNLGPAGGKTSRPIAIDGKTFAYLVEDIARDQAEIVFAEGAGFDGLLTRQGVR